MATIALREGYQCRTGDFVLRKDRKVPPPGVLVDLPYIINAKIKPKDKSNFKTNILLCSYFSTHSAD